MKLFNTVTLNPWSTVVQGRYFMWKFSFRASRYLMVKSNELECSRSSKANQQFTLFRHSELCPILLRHWADDISHVICLLTSNWWSRHWQCIEEVVNEDAINYIKITPLECNVRLMWVAPTSCLFSITFFHSITQLFTSTHTFTSVLQ